ncbi:hypothetical protein RFI_06877, partial [Reticulomyxa filosa]
MDEKAKSLRGDEDEKKSLDIVPSNGNKVTPKLNFNPESLDSYRGSSSLVSSDGYRSVPLASSDGYRSTSLVSANTRSGFGKIDFVGGVQPAPFLPSKNVTNTSNETVLKERKKTYSIQCTCNNKKNTHKKSFNFFFRNFVYVCTRKICKQHTKKKTPKQNKCLPFNCNFLHADEACYFGNFSLSQVREGEVWPQKRKKKKLELIDVCGQDMEICGMKRCDVFVPCALLEPLDDDIGLLVPGLIREEKKQEADELSQSLKVNETCCVVSNGIGECVEL